MRLLIFVAGVPAAGKSHFGRWLESNCGFIHIDPEENDQLDALAIHQLWDDCFVSRSCLPFAEALRQLGRPAVFNWGFPPPCLPVAQALKAAGFESWWLQADYASARAEFGRLGRSIAAFNAQVAAIEAAHTEIMQVFEPNILETLDRAGNRLGPEQIWAHIQRAV
jgi:hypothetical protein